MISENSALVGLFVFEEYLLLEFIPRCMEEVTVRFENQETIFFLVEYPDVKFRMNEEICTI